MSVSWMAIPPLVSLVAVRVTMVVSMSAAPAEPIPVWAVRVTAVVAVMFASSPAVLSVMAPAPDAPEPAVTSTVPLVLLITDRATSVKAVRSMFPESVVSDDPSSMVIAPLWAVRMTAPEPVVRIDPSAMVTVPSWAVRVTVPPVAAIVPAASTARPVPATTRTAPLPA